jgi:hypothetical protein
MFARLPRRELVEVVAAAGNLGVQRAGLLCGATAILSSQSPLSEAHVSNLGLKPIPSAAEASGTRTFGISGTWTVTSKYHRPHASLPEDPRPSS